mmetsp:Transcript_13654/g.27981  ORF Transcript_13654/g.27981 Transcript_13654/m.27981 type:complete len:111 (+) Transcript_13654:717-1049(+)
MDDLDEEAWCKGSGNCEMRCWMLRSLVKQRGPLVGALSTNNTEATLLDREGRLPQGTNESVTEHNLAVIQERSGIRLSSGKGLVFDLVYSRLADITSCKNAQPNGLDFAR